MLSGRAVPSGTGQVDLKDDVASGVPVKRPDNKVPDLLWLSLSLMLGMLQAI